MMDRARAHGVRPGNR